MRESCIEPSLHCGKSSQPRKQGGMSRPPLTFASLRPIVLPAERGTLKSLGGSARRREPPSREHRGERLRQGALRHGATSHNQGDGPWQLLASLAFRRKAPAGDSPWGEGATTLEWTLPSPPPFHQFETLPRVVSPDLGLPSLERQSDSVPYLDEFDADGLISDLLPPEKSDR